MPCPEGTRDERLPPFADLQRPRSTGPHDGRRSPCGWRRNRTLSPRVRATEVTFTLNAQISGIKKLFTGSAVQKSMDAEVAGFNRAKSVLEFRA